MWCEDDSLLYENVLSHSLLLTFLCDYSLTWARGVRQAEASGKCLSLLFLEPQTEWEEEET